MDIQWRTVQIFLDADGVAEVELDSENSSKMRCTCLTFSNAARCKHTKYIRKQLSDNDGHYSILIPEEVDDELALEAMEDPAAFRDFIIRYGKVEVID
jgi:hypothetical protein